MRNRFILILIPALLVLFNSCSKVEDEDEDNVTKPGTVVLNAPDDGASSVHHYPHFQWSNIDNADSYELEVSDDADFNYSYEDQTVTTNSYRDLDKFYSNDQYFWRVRAENEAGQGNWSEVFTFFIDEGSEGTSNEGPEYGNVLIFDSGLLEDEEKEIWVSGDSFGTYSVKTLTCPGTDQSSCNFEGESCAYLSTSVYAYGIEYDFQVKVYQGGSQIDVESFTSPEAGGCVIVDIQDF